MKHKILLFIFFSQITHIVYSQTDAYHAIVKQDSININRALFSINKYFESHLDGSDYVVFGLGENYILIEKKLDFFALYAFSYKKGIVDTTLFEYTSKKLNKVFDEKSYKKRNLYEISFVKKDIDIDFDYFSEPKVFLYLLFMKHGEKRFEMSVSTSQSFGTKINFNSYINKDIFKILYPELTSAMYKIFK